MNELGVIFDMDGVIIDSEPYHFKVLMNLHDKLGIKGMEERHAEFVGKSIKNMWQKLKSEFRLAHSVEELMELQVRDYLDFVAEQPINPISGAMELLVQLKQREVPMILASSSKMVLIDLVLKRFEMEEYFKDVISGDDLPFSKPDPAIYLRAVASIGLSPSHCIAIEDSHNGVRSAKAAGIHCVAFRNDHFGRQDLSLADWEVNTLQQITLQKLLDLCGQ
jgi:HAD superfamily hydrolase (TIGR01509 family)